VIAIMLAAGLAWLANEVIGGRHTSARPATPALTPAMIVASAIGESYVPLPLSAAIVFAFWRFGHKQRAILFVIAMTGALLIDESIKLAFRRTRPEPFFDYPVPVSYIFPSGHDLFSVVFFGTLAALISPGVRAIAGYAVVLVWVLTVAIGDHWRR
jgi:hypothetical protein